MLLMVSIALAQQRGPGARIYDVHSGAAHSYPFGQLQDPGLDQPWLEIFWAVEVRRAKPGFLLTRVFSRPKILATFFGAPNLDAMSVPEALVHSIRILVVPAVFLAHPWQK